jgi:hypothetical protein
MPNYINYLPINNTKSACRYEDRKHFKSPAPEQMHRECLHGRGEEEAAGRTKYGERHVSRKISCGYTKARVRNVLTL